MLLRVPHGPKVLGHSYGVIQSYTEVKSSLETNLAHLTIFTEVTDSKARMQSMQSSTSKAWGRNDCHEVQDRIGLFCVYQAHEGLHREIMSQ